MDIIPLEFWEPSPENPHLLRYAGQRPAQEVFAELHYRLKSMGYLPDEYFVLNDAWQSGREIPKDAMLYCTVDYGESEGVYLDVYLKWFAENKPITESFCVGKTLGENGADLDRMFLVASAITKAFYGEHASHSRYIQTGDKPDTGGSVLHLSQAEQRCLIDALVESRKQAIQQTIGLEQLLRRVTGSITEYINETGQHPIRIGDYDMAVLAVQDGNLEAFETTYPKVLDRAGELLIETAGRPSTIGRRMCRMLLRDASDITNDSYLTACKRAVDTADQQRVLFLTEQAQHCVKELSPAIYGEVIDYAYGEYRRNITTALIAQCSPEQIAAASSRVLFRAAVEGDYSTMLALVEKGIDANEYADGIFQNLYACQNGWMAEQLLERGMRIDSRNFSALHACIVNDGIRGGQLLLDRGMDFMAYKNWVKSCGLHTEDHGEVLKALEEYSTQLGQEQSASSAGGINLA